MIFSIFRHTQVIFLHFIPLIHHLYFTYIVHYVVIGLLDHRERSYPQTLLLPTSCHAVPSCVWCYSFCGPFYSWVRGRCCGYVVASMKRKLLWLIIRRSRQPSIQLLPPAFDLSRLYRVPGPVKRAVRRNLNRTVRCLTASTASDQCHFYIISKVMPLQAYIALWFCFLVNGPPSGKFISVYAWTLTRVVALFLLIHLVPTCTLLIHSRLLRYRCCVTRFLAVDWIRIAIFLLPSGQPQFTVVMCIDSLRRRLCIKPIIALSFPSIIHYDFRLQTVISTTATYRIWPVSPVALVVSAVWLSN